jgi:hypothetical protein
MLNSRRVSEHYGLPFTQASLDFVDVSVRDDLQVYIDPNALRVSSDQWAHTCTSLIQSFFQALMALIRTGNLDRAQALMSPLTEPNETHFGVSRGQSKGRGVGPERSLEIIQALAGSAAIRSGIITDLEETVLLIPGIGPDLISDLITNIIRGSLISYTQLICAHYNIPLVEGVASGPIWDASTHTWREEFTSMPVVNGRRLLLVPKFIVRKKLDFDAGAYYDHYILTYLRDEELRQNTELVHLIKDQRRSTKHRPVYKRVVYKGEVAEKHGSGKPTSTRVTVTRPQLLRSYTADRRAFPTPPMTAAELASPPDYSTLLGNVTSIRPGTDAHGYEDAVEALLSAIFDGQLSFPEREVKIHHGRKRVDIVYSNTALTGFFKWVAAHYTAPYIVIECKNYIGDPANPELDQIAGRFSPSRGKVGFIVCRSFKDKDTFVERCRDTALDHRGFIIALDDADLSSLVTFKLNDDASGFERFLRDRFAPLVR